MVTARSLFLTALVAASRATAQDTNIDIPNGLTPRPLDPDVYGYSIEPVWLESYLSTPLASNLLSIIANVTGKAPPIRVGGNTADQTYIYSTLPTGGDSVSVPNATSAKTFNITPNWFDTWADYFPTGTDLIYTLNLAVNDSAWTIAVQEAQAAHAALGDKLVMFELGNEIDHFINKGWRDATWDVATYTEQFRNLTGQITGSDWYQAVAEESRPKFQAGVFADPPWVPDQQDEIDDFSIENLTHAFADPSSGVDLDIVETYATHLYPQSTCDTARWLRMRLDLLSNHTTLWLNVSQFGPQAAAAEATGKVLVMGETNSVSCSGRSGISDTFGAALWGVDYVLMGAALGIRKLYFHLGATSEYSAFTPLPYELKNETLQPGIRPGWYAHYFIAKAVAPPFPGARLSVAALPGANSSALSGYAIYSSDSGANYSSTTLAKLVLLDMGIWNGTAGLSNPSTLAATDNDDPATFSAGARPNSTLTLANTPSWCPGARVRVTRLTAPGTNAKSGVAVSGVAFDDATGDRVGREVRESLTVGEKGKLSVSVRRAEAVLLELEVVGEGGLLHSTMPLLVPQVNANANDAPAPAAPDSQGQSSGSGSGEAARPTGAGVDTGAGTTREKTAAEIEADRLYEERMEEEYAKREGGA
ncbi:glycoside hydrolase superfamily [Biscogniauxia mediterranea]|nr:glycoside hydrolase superfamily [Biscogniauxia mediterranea]